MFDFQGGLSFLDFIIYSCTEYLGIITINSEEKNHSQARYASLDKKIIQPFLEELNFIEIEKIGRNSWIKITQ